MSFKYFVNLLFRTDLSATIPTNQRKCVKSKMLYDTEYGFTGHYPNLPINHLSDILAISNTFTQSEVYKEV